MAKSDGEYDVCQICWGRIPKGEEFSYDEDVGVYCRRCKKRIGELKDDE